jgi:N-acetyl sugar amidotransferase
VHDESGMCVRCVLTASDDPALDLDDAGVCVRCREYERFLVEYLPPVADGPRLLEELATKIRDEGRDKEHDCVLGLSGGTDSSFVAYQAKRLGLRPLVVHFDNGWNSELAVQNIERIVRHFDFDLHTYVVDWEEFRDLQLSYFRASVVDIEVPTDHAIFAVLYRTALDEGIHYILSGNNVRTEFGMPPSWSHRKSDLRNLKAIHRRYGTNSLKTFPTASTFQMRWWERTRRLQVVNVLDYLPYDKKAAIGTLETELGWRDYGGKHYESFFTRFYQAHVLPTKFGIDKRRGHLSALIRSDQLTRDAALSQLAEPAYDAQMLETDRTYVLKKLGLTREEWEAIMATPPRSHRSFPSDERLIRFVVVLKGIGRRVRRRPPAKERSSAPNVVGGAERAA